MAKKKNFEFSRSFEKLEKLVEKMEGGEMDLDEGLKMYEEGIVLVKDCKEYLKEVENKVSVIRDMQAHD